MKNQRMDGTFGIHPYFDIWHSWDGTIFSSTHHLFITLQEIPWYSFLLEAEWTLGILNVNRRNRSLENFQGPYQAFNP